MTKPVIERLRLSERESMLKEEQEDISERMRKNIGMKNKRF